MALARDEQAQVAQPGEAETRVARGEAAPPVVQHVVVCLGADFPGDEDICWCSGGRFAAREEVGARSADGVLDHVGQEQRQDHADQPAEQRDVGFVCAGAGHEGPEGQGE